jgi:uncharacterized protein HemX
LHIPVKQPQELHPVAAAADKTKKTAEKDKAAKPRSPILITALVAVLAAAAAGGGVWFFTQSKHEDKAAQAPKKSAPRPRHSTSRWTRRSWSTSTARSTARATCSWKCS